MLFFNHIPTGSTCHTRSGQYTQARRENMPTELKSETARANGAKSHGPITTEGKEKSSKNALKHGMTSRNTCILEILECESADEFKAFLAEHISIHPRKGAGRADAIAH